MGQSIDYRKIELVSQFAGLLEALSDPTLKDTLVEARKVVEEKKALLGPLAEKANLDALIDREEAKLEDQKNQMQALLEQAQKEADRIKAEAELIKDDAKVVAQQAQLEREQALNALKEAKVEVEQANKFKQEINLLYENVKKREAECDVREASLKEKLEKLTLVLGSN